MNTRMLPNPFHESTGLLLWGLAGIILFALGHVFVEVDFDAICRLFGLAVPPHPLFGVDIEPFWVLTPLYIAPIAVGLVLAGKLRFAGATFIVLAVTAAHYLAQTTAVQIFNGLTETLTDTSVAKVAKNILGQPAGFYGTIGAGAGIVGSAVSFAVLACLGPDMRLLPKLKTAAIFTLGLGLIGAASLYLTFGFEPKEGRPEIFDRVDSVLKLYAPWQGLFTLATMRLFKNRIA